ncbi:MAG: antirestriction protein ArdA [Lysobacteraceae bacterium]
MQIYIACLASYNAGILHGRWIDASDADEMHEDICDILRSSPCPNVTVRCPHCDGRGTLPAASCISAERRPCPECNGAGTVPSAEEYAVHDYDGIPATFGEYPSLDELAAWVEAATEHGDAFAECWEDLRGDTVAEKVADFADHFAGTFDRPLDWAEDFIEDTGMLQGVPEEVARYFDTGRWLRDYRLTADIDFVDARGGCHVLHR